MTKVAAVSHLSSANALQFGGGSGGGGGSKISTSNLKRKTPSELRGELLKQKNLAELVDDSPDSVLTSTRNTDVVLSGLKKLDSSKVPRYIDTRMDELFPVTKNAITLKLLSRKTNAKESVEPVDILKKSGVPIDLNGRHSVDNARMDGHVASEAGKHHSSQDRNTTEKCSTTFQSVRELSLGCGVLNGSSPVDMVKALKGLVSCESQSISAPHSESVDNVVHVVAKSYCSEFQVPGLNIPLDLTLKTNMRLLSASSVNWLHRLLHGGTLPQINSSIFSSQSTGCSLEPVPSIQRTIPHSFHSWVYPQTTLPRSVIAALTSTAGGSIDFLSTRQQAWEDSFRSLYYMLRNRICKMFYVCTEQFVVLFTGADAKEMKCSCFAYVSQSTTNFRSLIKEHGASFSMPLCHSKVEEAAAEDLVELSEIKKYNLGQTRAMETMAGVDNSPQSLLMFRGNKNVHVLYDFLLNYRFFLTSLTGGDVPVLYSQISFQNAALSTPEVKCKQSRKLDHSTSQLKESSLNSCSYGSICYTMDIKDAYLPPWVVCGICDAMHSHGIDFQASFVTDSTSVGLNIGLGSTKDQPSSLSSLEEKPLQESGHSFGIPNATRSPQLTSAFLKGLKCCSGTYTASLSPVA